MTTTTTTRKRNDMKMASFVNVMLIGLTILFMMQTERIEAAQTSAKTSTSTKSRSRQHASFQLPELETSMRIETSPQKVKLKLVNGQLLVGNRKVVELHKRKQQHQRRSTSEYSRQATSRSRGDRTDRWDDERTGRGGSDGSADQDSHSVEERIVYEFLGVPFAQAPVGPLRFQFPHRLNNILTQEKYNATYFRPSCFQVAWIQERRGSNTC